MTSHSVEEVAKILEKNYLESGKYDLPNISDDELAKLLQEGSEEIKSLLHVAVSLDCREAVQKFLDLKADPNFHPTMDSLHPLLLAQSITVIGMLLDAGADIHLKCNGFCSFFDFVCMDSNFKVLKFLLAKNSSLIQNIKEFFNLEEDTKESIISGAFGIMYEHGLTFSTAD